MISTWVAAGIALLATNVGFLIGAWWASLPRTDDRPCREDDGLETRQTPVDRTPDLGDESPAADRRGPGVRSTFPRRIP